MKKIPGLDFLRAVAIMLVMLYHCQVFPLTSRAGWTGVDLFFVLSGFLVSGLLFKEFQKTGSVKPFRFLIRRGFKIYPLFYFVLLLHLVYFTMHGRPFSNGNILAEVFFYQNYRPGIMTISWSLAVEEHFYILLALTVFIAARTGRIKNSLFIPFACLFVSLVCLGLRYYTYWNYGIGIYVIHFPTHLRIDSLAFGVLLSYWFNFHHSAFMAFFKRFRWILCLLIAGLLAPAFFDNGPGYTSPLGYTTLYAGYGILMCLVIASAEDIRQSPAGRGLPLWAYRLISKLGTYSYAIYLVHYIIAGPWVAGFVYSKFHPDGKLWYVVVYLGANIVAGILLTKVIEQPFLTLREKLFPQPGFRPVHPV